MTKIMCITPSPEHVIYPRWGSEGLDCMAKCKGTGKGTGGQDGTGRDGTGRDGTGRDGTGQEGTGRDGT